MGVLKQLRMKKATVDSRSSHRRVSGPLGLRTVAEGLDKIRTCLFCLVHSTVEKA